MLAYFYFDFNDPEKQDCRGLLSSLVFQIGIASEKGFRYLRRELSYDPPVYEKLLAMLSMLLGFSGRTCIIIDALDECPEPARDTGLLVFLDHLHTLRIREDVNLRVFVASRQEPDIWDSMRTIATHCLSFNESPQHMGDICDYISSQLFDGGSKLYLGWSDDVKEKVQKTLTKRSNGM